MCVCVCILCVCGKVHGFLQIFPSIFWYIYIYIIKRGMILTITLRRTIGRLVKNKWILQPICSYIKFEHLWATLDVNLQQSKLNLLNISLSLYIYIYTRTLSQTHAYTHTLTHTHTHIYVCMYVCECVYLCVCVSNSILEIGKLNSDPSGYKELNSFEVKNLDNLV